MTFLYFLLFFGGPVSAVTPAANTIRRVEVAGNVRFPTAGILRLISSAPGKALDQVQASEDLRRLHATGFFREITVEGESLPDGRVDLKFEVAERPFVSGLTITGVSSGLEQQIRETLKKQKLEPRPATAFSPAEAARAGALVRNMLRAMKYPQPEVRVDTFPESSPNVVRVDLVVHAGPRLRVGAVEFTGNVHATSEELLKQMQHTRPGHPWAFWSRGGGYVQEGLAADVERIRALYRSRGFASVQIGSTEISARMGETWIPFVEDKPELHIRIPLNEGPAFELKSVSLRGDGKSASGAIAELLAGVNTPGGYDASLLERVRVGLAHALGQAGYALADVRLEQSVDESARSVHAVYRIEAGQPAVVGRVRFEGNHRIPDRFLRRELLADEGQLFDSSKLDRSIVRLNRSGLVKEVARADVALEMDPEREELDVTFKVKENDLRGVYGTGGIANGGYLGLIYSAFNLLGVGERISLELDGGAAQSNLLLNMVGRHFLGSPFTIGLSAFHRLTDLNIANIVPGTQDIVNAFRQRSSGIGLSGSFPLTTKARVGLAYQVANGTVTAHESGRSAYTRGEITPTFVLDSTLDHPGRRGYRAEFARTWAGPASLRSIEAGREAFRLSAFAPDPWTRGRNTFGFRLQGAFAHPGTHALAPDLRLYPGTEVARGFGRGALSVWGVTDGGTSASDLRVLGADALLGFSAEYRVPISGPLSGAGFFDTGWSALRRGSVQSGTGVALIRKTSSVVRASTGAELRLQLPVLRQPARLIFAWNPLRLDKLVGGASPFRLADPRTAMRFALGDW